MCMSKGDGNYQAGQQPDPLSDSSILFSDQIQGQTKLHKPKKQSKSLLDKEQKIDNPRDTYRNLKPKKI